MWPRKKEEKWLDELSGVILSLKTKKQVKKFLDAILTPKEKLEIAKRLQIVKMLFKGLPQQKIADKLNAGIATVTRGSREVQAGKFDFLKDFYKTRGSYFWRN